MAAGSGQIKSMAMRVGDAVGFDPITIITIIQTIIGILQSCKKPASKNAAAAMIDDEFDVIVSNRRADKCPLQFRKAFRQSGVTDRHEQNDLWAAMVMDAKSNRAVVSGVLVA